MSRPRQIDLLLLGKTGNGKSATGNTILRRVAFESSASATSVTKEISTEVTEYKGTTIKVVDGPGVGDTDLDGKGGMQMIMEEMHTAMKMSPEGYHAFLLVVQFGARITQEDGDALDQLRAIFGSRLLKEHGILVFTHGDNFEKESKKSGKTFQQWYEAQTGRLQKIIKECNKRVVLFDNDTDDEEKISAQIDNLLKMVDNLLMQGIRYCDKHFKEAKSDRDRAFVLAKEPQIRDEIMQETSLILQKLEKIHAQEKMSDKLPLLDALNSQVDSLSAHIQEEDNGTGALHKLAQAVETIRQTVQNEIQISLRFIEEDQRRKDEEEKQRKEREEFKRSIEKEKENLKKTLEEQRKVHEAMLAKQEAKFNAEKQTNKKELERREQEIKQIHEDFKKEMQKKEATLRQAEEARKKLDDAKEKERTKLEKEKQDKQDKLQKETSEKLKKVTEDYKTLKGDMQKKMREASTKEVEKKSKCSIL